MLKKRVIASILCLALIITFMPFTASAAETTIEQYLGKDQMEVPSLKEVYKDHFLVGNIIDPGTGAGQIGNEYTTNVYNRHYNAVTAQNSMKPNAYGSTKAAFPNFTGNGSHEQIAKWAKTNGMSLIGHTLAWHAQSSWWLNRTSSSGGALTRAEAKANLELFVTTVAGHFESGANDMAAPVAWDVLNEAFLESWDGEDWTKSLRMTGTGNDAPYWWQSYENGANKEAGESGADYIYDVFMFARKAAPSAKLIYNDFNEVVYSKREAIAAMVEGINAQWATDTVNNTEAVANADDYTGRLLIENIGMQAHYGWDTNINAIEATIKRYIETGATVSITELDVSAGSYSTNLNNDANASYNPTHENFVRQGQFYAQLFSVLKKYSANIDRVSFWGLSDSQNWRPEGRVQLFTWQGTGANRTYQAKLAYCAVIDPEGFLETYPVIPPVRNPRQGTAFNGTPVLQNGVIDPIWDNAEAMVVDRLLDNNGSNPTAATGVVKTIWDGEAMHVLTVVTDVAQYDGGAEYEHDCVEVYLGEKNGRLGFLDNGDGQYRVNYKNLQSGSATTLKGFASEAWLTDTGYVVQMKIPFKVVNPTADLKVGFDVQISDANPKASGGNRTNRAAFCDETNGSGWADNSGWGEVTLLGKPAPVLSVTTNANLVKKGDYFRVNAFFNEVVNSNTAVLNYVFDTSKFDFHGFTPADDVGLVSVNATDTGAKVTVMITNYNTKDYGEVLLAAKDSVDLAKAVNEISLNVDYVVKNDDGEKEIKQASASTTFKSTDDKGTGPNGEYTLIDLSNIIDGFGKTSADDDWDDYVYCDFNGDGIIDILDITNIAQKI